MQLSMKNILIGGIAVVVLLVVLLSFSGIGIKSIMENHDPRIILRDQAQELNEEIEELKSKNEKYILENTNLKAEIQGLVSSQPGGFAMEEKRKGLVAKEAELERRERRLVGREETILLAEKRIAIQQQEFYEKTGLKMEEIGEAKQIKNDYEYMQRRLEESEERANDWLKIIYAISIVFFVGVFSLVAFLMHMATKNRKIDAAIRTIDSIDLSAQDRNLLMTSLGGRLIDPRRTDAESP